MVNWDILLLSEAADITMQMAKNDKSDLEMRRIEKLCASWDIIPFSVRMLLLRHYSSVHWYGGILCQSKALFAMAVDECAIAVRNKKLSHYLIEKIAGKREMMNVYIDTNRRRMKKNHCGLLMDNGYRSDTLQDQEEMIIVGRGEMEDRRGRLQ